MLEHERAAREGAGRIRLDVTPSTTRVQEADVGMAVDVGLPPQWISAQLLAGQEAERRRIARDLHDIVGQALTAVKLSLQSLHRVHDDIGEGCTQIDESIATVEVVLQQVRTFAFELRPPILDDLGLVPTLRWHADRVARRAELAVRLEADGDDPRLPPEIETTCFRVAQEALTNVVRHAHARSVVLRLTRQARTAVLEVEDDGVGFDPSTSRDGPAGLGIMGMRERSALLGGRLDIISEPGAGTHVIATFPLGPAALSRRTA